MVVVICRLREDCARSVQRATCDQNFDILLQLNQSTAQRMRASEVKAAVLPRP